VLAQGEPLVNWFKTFKLFKSPHLFPPPATRGRMKEGVGTIGTLGTTGTKLNASCLGPFATLSRIHQLPIEKVNNEWPDAFCEFGLITAARFRRGKPVVTVWK
jgi:hypothetical protein